MQWTYSAASPFDRNDFSWYGRRDRTDAGGFTDMDDRRDVVVLIGVTTPSTIVSAFSQSAYFVEKLFIF